MGAPSDPLTGFIWRPGRKGETNGIYFWDDVFLYDNPSGKVAILVMDTQGLFEPDMPSSVNTKIIGLSTLISSIQVFNIKGYIQENDLEYLEMTTKFTKLVQDQMAKSGQSDSTIRPFQKMIFLLRDWEDDQVEFGFEGGEDHKREILARKTKSSEAMNVRKNIEKAFESISFFLMPKPGDEANITGFNGSFGQLKSEFVENMKILIESIFAPKNLNLKKVFGSVVTGKEFSNIVLKLFDIYNSDDIPQVKTLFQATAEIEIAKIIEQLTQEYKRNYVATCNFKNSNFIAEMKNKHQTEKAKALEKFKNTPRLADEKMEKDALIKLETILDSNFTVVLENKIEEFNKYQENEREKMKAAKEKEELQRVLQQEEENHRREIQQEKASRQKDSAEFYEKLETEKEKNEQKLYSMQMKFDSVASELMSEKAARERQTNDLKEKLQEEREKRSNDSAAMKKTEEKLSAMREKVAAMEHEMERERDRKREEDEEDVVKVAGKLVGNVADTGKNAVKLVGLSAVEVVKAPIDLVRNIFK